MFRCFRVERNDIGTGPGEVRNDAVDRFDHQVNVDRHVNQRTDRRTDHGADRQVGNVMVVHDIEMDHVGACRDDMANFVTQLREIGGEDTGGDTVGSHEKKQIDECKSLFYTG